MVLFDFNSLRLVLVAFELALTLVLARKFSGFIKVLVVNSRALNVIK